MDMLSNLKNNFVWLVAIACTCLGVGSHYVLAQDDSAETIIARYVSYLESMDRVTFSFRGPGESDEGGMKKDGNDYWIKTGNNDNVSEFSCIDGKGILCNKNSLYATVSPGASEWVITSRVNPSAEQYHFAELFDYPFIFGFFTFKHVNDVRFLPDYFRSGHVVVEKVNVDGSEHFLLKRNEDGVDVSLWIDPSKNYAAVRVLATQKNYPLEPGTVVLRESIIHDFASVKNDIFVPTSYSETYEVVGMTYEQVDGQPQEKLYVASGKRNVVFRDWAIPSTLKESDFVITSDIPDYTKVYMQDAPQIEHIWLDGKIVLLTDEVALAHARGHGFIPGVREPRFWMMALGIGLILFALGRMIYRYFKGDS